MKHIKIVIQSLAIQIKQAMAIDKQIKLTMAIIFIIISIKLDFKLNFKLAMDILRNS